MAPSGVSQILDAMHTLKVEVTDRLARIETKQDADYADKLDLQTRVRRLELGGVGVLLVVGAKVLGVELPLFD